MWQFKVIAVAGKQGCMSQQNRGDNGARPHELSQNCERQPQILKGVIYSRGWNTTIPCRGKKNEIGGFRYMWGKFPPGRGYFLFFIHFFARTAKRRVYFANASVCVTRDLHPCAGRLHAHLQAWDEHEKNKASAAAATAAAAAAMSSHQSWVQ